VSLPDTFCIIIWGYLDSNGKVVYALCCTVSHFVTTLACWSSPLGGFRVLVCWLKRCYGGSRSVVDDGKLIVSSWCRCWWKIMPLFLCASACPSCHRWTSCVGTTSYTQHADWVCGMPSSWWLCWLYTSVCCLHYICFVSAHSLQVTGCIICVTFASCFCIKPFACAI
jgi:hypothetical protein